jgi:alpha-L-fucosidase
MDFRNRKVFEIVRSALSVLLMLLVVGSQLLAEETGDAEQQTNERLRWWREARFGLFVHWGPVSLTGKEIGWARGGERRGTGGRGDVPVEVYDNLYKEFNPVKFDAKEWVSIAKASGMKYLVFTTKHHDGFSMFDSKLTDYKITNSPFKRDVVAELAEACHEAGLELGFYYSPPDWHHPDYRTANHSRYIEYLHGQLQELCTNYGRLGIIWFDGLGGTAKDWDSERLVKMIRRLQPQVIINNRAGLPEDYDTPEQQVGQFQIHRPWESCITICQQWAWKPDDRMKSLKECIDILVRCAGGDGNLLLNVGPMPTGEIEPRQVARLKEIGLWLNRYGEAIYSTRGGPFRPGPWGASTYRGNKIYLHILSWQEDQVVLPVIQRKVVSASVLTGGSMILKQAADRIELFVPKEDRSDLDTIVVLELDGPAADANPATLPSRSAAARKPATASNVFQNSSDYGPDKALDDDPSTRWATDSGVHAAWLAVDLGKPATIEAAFLSEAFDRVQAFELQSRRDDAWKTFFKGTKIGRERSLKFSPVTARSFRLNILEATEGPTLWEFQLFPAEK